MKNRERMPGDNELSCGEEFKDGDLIGQGCFY